MNIEIVHNPMKLWNRGIFRVKTPKRANECLKAWAEDKALRGYKLRHIFREEDGTIELQSDHFGRFDMAIRFLKNAGFKPKKIHWTDNKILTKIIRKDYSSKPEASYTVSLT